MDKKDYLYWRDLPDGREICVITLLGGRGRICLGRYPEIYENW
jgi:hypothetical protein